MSLAEAAPSLLETLVEPRTVPANSIQPEAEMSDSRAGHTESIPLGMLEFLAWVDARPRTYADTMEAWRSSCPRLSIWEDAVGSDLVRIDTQGASTQGSAGVHLTDRGLAVLRDARPSAR